MGLILGYCLLQLPDFLQKSFGRVKNFLRLLKDTVRTTLTGGVVANVGGNKDGIIREQANEDVELGDYDA